MIGSDRRAHFVERFGAGGFMVNHFYDVKAILRFDQVGNCALGEAESCLLKFRDGLAFDNPVQIATLGLGRVVFGIFFGEVFKIRAVFCLLEDILSLLANFGDFRVRLSDGFEENMFHVNAILDFVLVNVGVVIGL